jgi:hypothetical protein
VLSIMTCRKSRIIDNCGELKAANQIGTTATRFSSFRFLGSFHQRRTKGRTRGRRGYCYCRGRRGNCSAKVHCRQ